jgi:hypothetical protein
VLDFVGTHRREFRFDLRYRALLGGTRSDLERAVQGGFPFLPAGCHMELDRVASEIVLRSIKDAIPTRWPAKVHELRALHAARPGDVSLSEFLRDTGLDLEDVYAGNRTWSELRDVAGLDVAPPGPHETALRRGIARLLHIDDPQRTQTYPVPRLRDQPDLNHWESQSTTRADSPTGRRYQSHGAMGRSILLFARTRQDDRAFWFLGPATYVRHEGEQPMAVTWKLETPLSGDLFAAFAAAVA